MYAKRWESVKNLLHDAMQLTPAQRGPFLDEACSTDASLRAELESLLAAEEKVPSSFMDAPLLADERIAESLLNVESSGGLKAGQIFADRFQLVRKLGEGGMGQVWLAEQIAPVRRPVALKLIKAGMYDEAVVQRFQAERQSLAIMDHPAIAKVFDAGTTPQGQPYFVMEYVPGLPITEYCDQKKLKISERLELFIQACEGVQHAHQKAIIHRDLKPANILVAEVDGKAVPRIIDFGLAKAITPQAEGASLFTQLGHFVGTPGYMSPEQVDPLTQDIDTRTDVYSLGVVLYVLLTGLEPFETKRRQKQPLDELLRKLREEEPPRASTKVGTDRDTSAGIAEARGTGPKQLVNLLRGDLDWIAMKALEKDRSRRYGAVSELAADVRRYLDHESIVARPSSLGYRLRKYVRRHRVVVIVAAGLVLLLTAFSIVQGVQLRRITRERDRANLERDRANRERDRATRITDFMTGMFTSPDPREARGNSVTVREILDKASTQIETGMAKDPEVQAQMMWVMARTYMNLGLLDHAHDLAKRALDIRMSLLGPNNADTLESVVQLGWILVCEGHFDQAEKMERQALIGERQLLGDEDARTLGTMGNLGATLEDEGKYGEEEKLERELIEITSRKLGPESEEKLRSMNHLASALAFEAHYQESEREYRELLDISRRRLGPDHPQTLSALGGLAAVIDLQGRAAEAEQLDREVLAADRRVLGPEHENTVIEMENLGSLLSTEGHLAEAEKLHREALGILLRTQGPEHPDTLMSQSNLARVLLQEGHVREAEKLQRETLATRTRVLGPENRRTLLSQSSLAEILIREGRYEEGEKLARETFHVQLRSLGPQHPDTLDSMQQLGMALAYTHRYAAATAMFREATEKDSNSTGQGDSFSVWYSFACVAVAGKHTDDAIRYLREAINRGYKDGDRLMADDDLKSLRQDPRFLELADELKRPPTKTQGR
jgi:serine/threonine protein kinase/tetratricopeptide (TPR) repeat protein